MKLYDYMGDQFEALTHVTQLAVEINNYWSSSKTIVFCLHYIIECREKNNAMMQVCEKNGCGLFRW